MKRLGFIVFFVISALIFSTETAKATHTAGMDMFYRHTVDSTYEFTLVFYRNCPCRQPTCCGTAGPPLAPIINANSLTQGTSNSFTLAQMPTSGPGVPPISPPNLYNCTESTTPGYLEYVYRGTWTSPKRATDWVFSYSLCCRPTTNAPANVTNGTQWIECGLNNLDFPDQTAKNWSPIWHNRRPNHPGYLTDTVTNFLFRTLCEGNFYTLDQGVREYQNDIIEYEIAWPQTNGGNNINYINGYCFSGCAQGQLPTQNGPITINPNTGIINIVPGTPTGTQVYVVALKATELRNDTIWVNGLPQLNPIQIGFIKRDMTLWIDDTTSCRKDSIHPKDTTVNFGGDTVMDVFFASGSGPNNRVRCETISPDGSEFRLLDSSLYEEEFARSGIGYDSLVKSIGVYKATWTCKTGNADRIRLHFAEKLNCGKYTIMLKRGTDLDVLESECGFLEPEFSYGTIHVARDVPVNTDVGNVLSICLPTNNANPQIVASSPDDTLGLTYQWFLNGDSIDGQEVPYVFADTIGEYKIQVEDPYKCFGDTTVQVWIDTVPHFLFSLPPYCDKFGEAATLPDMIVAPESPVAGGTWEWIVDGVGTIHVGDTLDSSVIIKDVNYTLRFTKPPMGNGAQSCYSEYKFAYDRTNYPPVDSLFVRFDNEDLVLCATDADTGVLSVWDDGLRDKFAPLSYSWYQNNELLNEQGPTILVNDTGSYRIFVEDTLGCWGQYTTRVSHDYRQGSFEIPCTINNDVAIFTWEDVPNAYAYEVSLDGGLTWIPASNGDYHRVTNIVDQQYIMVRALTTTACKYTEAQESNQCPDRVFPPNVFTPNKDGLNDVFYVRGLDLFPGSTVEIYDRWGNMVHKDDNYRNDWDGEDLDEGTYYYIIRVNDPHDTIHKGFITLLR